MLINNKEINIREKNIVSKGKFYKTYIAHVQIGIDPFTRKKLYKDITAPSIELLKEKITEIMDCHYYRNPTKISMYSYIRRWFEISSPTRKKDTNKGYNYIIESWMKHYFSDIKISDFNYEECQKYFNYLFASSLKSITVNTHRIILKSVCEMAVSENILYINPVKYTRLPKREISHKTIIEYDEIPLFIESIKDSPIREICLIAFIGALRIGEVLGLSWDNIDFEKKCIVISQQLATEEIDGSMIVHYTKSNNPRTLYLPDIAFEILKTVKTNQELNHKKNIDNLAFTYKNGKPYTRTNVRRLFKPIKLKMNKPNMRFHDLRHSMATILMEQCNDLDQVRAFLGHIHPGTTLLYIQPTRNGQKQLVECISSCFDNSDI